MQVKNLLDRAVQTLSGVALGGKKKDPKLGSLDRGVLEVSLLVAALDGTILPTEYAAFELLIQNCRGYSRKNARECLDKALRNAGYLMAAAQVGIYTEKELLETFMELATEALPFGFGAGSTADLRRAFALWTVMGASDGEFSELEHKAVMGLLDKYAMVTVGRSRRTCLLEEDYIEKVEGIVRDLAVASKAGKAAEALDALIGTVVVRSKDGRAEVRKSSALPLELAAVTLACCVLAPSTGWARPRSGRISVSAYDGRGNQTVCVQSVRNERPSPVYEEPPPAPQTHTTTYCDGSGKTVRRVEQTGDTTVVRDGKGRLISTTVQRPDGTFETRDGRGRIQTSGN